MNRLPRSRTPEAMLPQFNPEIDPSCRACQDGCPLEYVAVRRDDGVTRPGLALYMQDAACRRFAHYRLHRRIGAAFMDAPGTRRTGFKRLLAHLAICHNRQVLVSRLDRLPVSRRRPFGRLVVRTLSATEPNTRARTDQADLMPAIRATIHDLFDQQTTPDTGKEHRR